MINRRSRILTAVFVCLTALSLTACGTGVKVPDEYNYDLSKYIKLGNYKNVEYDKTEIQVTQQEVMDYIDTERNENTESEKLSSGTVQSDSLINIDYVGKIDGKKFDGGSAEGVDVDMAENNFIDGFAAGILGHEVGETFDINVTFPSNYSSADVAGKAAVFTITVNYIEKQTLPEYNDSYVKKYTKYDNIEDYESAVKEELEEQKEDEQETADRLVVFNKILESSEVIKTPTKEYKARYKSYVNTYKAQAEQNDTEFDTYIQESLGMTTDDFYAQAKEYANSVVKQELVLYAIAEKEKIKISDSDYDEYVNELLEDAGYTAKSYKQTYGITIAEYAESNNLFSTLLYKEVMDKVMEYSVGTVAK